MQNGKPNKGGGGGGGGRGHHRISPIGLMIMILLALGMISMMPHRHTTGENWGMIRN